MADIKKNGTLVSTAKKNSVNFCFTERVQTGQVLTRQAGTIWGVDSGNYIYCYIGSGDYDCTIEYEIVYGGNTPLGVRTVYSRAGTGTLVSSLSCGRGGYARARRQGTSQWWTSHGGTINPEYSPTYSNVRRARLMKSTT